METLNEMFKSIGYSKFFFLSLIFLYCNPFEKFY